VRSSPAITRNGTIYIGSADNRLYAVGADGKLKWKFTTGGQVFSPTVADDGTIYVQSGDGKIYAIKDAEENGGLSGQWPKLGADLRNTARGNH
jgi:outer membrane protein assembly factor BamB